MRRKILKAVVTTALDPQSTCAIEALGVAVVQRFICGLQPHLIAGRIRRRARVYRTQRLDVIKRQLPGLAGIVIALSADVTVEKAVRLDSRVDEQRAKAVALCQGGCVIATEGASHQRWLAQIRYRGFQLVQRLARMMMQSRYAQARRHPHAFEQRNQLLRLGRRRRAIEAVYIKKARLIG